MTIPYPYKPEGFLHGFFAAIMTYAIKFAENQKPFIDEEKETIFTMMLCLNRLKSIPSKEHCSIPNDRTLSPLKLIGIIIQMLRVSRSFVLFTKYANVIGLELKFESQVLPNLPYNDINISFFDQDLFRLFQPDEDSSVTLLKPNKDWFFNIKDRPDLIEQVIDCLKAFGLEPPEEFFNTFEMKIIINCTSSCCYTDPRIEDIIFCCKYCCELCDDLDDFSLFPVACGDCKNCRSGSKVRDICGY